MPLSTTVSSRKQAAIQRGPARSTCTRMLHAPAASPPLLQPWSPLLLPLHRARARKRSVLSDEVPLVISRQLLTAYAQELGALPADVHKAAATQ